MGVEPFLIIVGYREPLFGGYLQLTCLPPLHELVRYGTPFLRSGGTHNHLILVLIDDDLAHLWDELGYGVVRHPPPIGH